MVALNPPHAAAYRARAGAYFQRNDLPRALADASMVMQLAPTSWQAYSVRAGVRVVMGDSTGAIEDLRKVIAL